MFLLLQVDITNKSTFVDMSNYITNGEWELIKCKIVRNEVIYPIGDAVYPDVTITIIMHRFDLLFKILYLLCNLKLKEFVIRTLR